MLSLPNILPGSGGDSGSVGPEKPFDKKKVIFSPEVHCAEIDFDTPVTCHSTVTSVSVQSTVQLSDICDYPKTPLTKCSKIRGAWGDYQLAPQWKEWALSQLGVQNSQIAVDLFATADNTTETCFIPKETDAFAFDWAHLCPDTHYLWANPPFRHIGKVLAKVAIEPCQLILCAPEWEQEPWWERLLRMSKQRVFLPEGVPIFFGKFRQTMLPAPSWRHVVCLLDTRQVPLPISDEEDTKWVLSRKKSKGIADVSRTVPADPENVQVRMVDEGSSDSAAPRRMEVRLHIRSFLCVEGTAPVPVRVLVDTGAEVSLVRAGLIPDQHLSPARHPIRLFAANKKALGGGRLEVCGGLQFQAVEVESKKRSTLTAPCYLYAAEIEEDVILSYRWLVERGVDVCPRKHGVTACVGRTVVWIQGERTISNGCSDVVIPREPMFIRGVHGSEAPRALDLFCGRKSATQVLERWGFTVVSLDSDPRRQPTICCDIMEWEYKEQYPPGYFSLITASPPCTQYSLAKTVGERDLEGADRIVQRTLDIIAYFSPEKWWLETPATGLLPRRDLMRGYPRVVCDYCRFEECGFRKPTCFFGSAHVAALQDVLCDGRTCASLVPPDPEFPNRRRQHHRRYGGHVGGMDREVGYHIPAGCIEYVCGFAPAPAPWSEVPVPAGHIRAVRVKCEREESLPDDSFLPNLEWVRLMRITSHPHPGPKDEESEEVQLTIARHLSSATARIQGIKAEQGVTQGAENPLATQLRDKLLAEFKETALCGVYKPHPKIRGPFGQAEIWLRPDAKPVSMPPFRLNERREVLRELVEKARAAGKLEDGQGPWNTPAFPVPKKETGKFRLVQDLRPQNAATIKDGHPLPRIGDMLQRQGKCRVWTTLDMVDGFHQMPMRPEHRHITCMSTPQGTQQWTVLVMGLKNAGSQFQRMMEWVLRDLPHTDPYIDDLITGSEGETEEQALIRNYNEVRDTLLQCVKEEITCRWDKSEFFRTEVEFCGHLLREGRRSPAPGKLLPIQLWELPQTVTELRGFLGLTNYFAEYVPHYAEVAAPLMGKLKLSRQDGKKGSQLRLVWTEEERVAFQAVKAKLCEKLELWQPDLDRPYELRCDASGHAIGAELRQEFEGVWRTVGLFSRKLAKSQLNWAPREKETYAIVAALRKWSGLIGFQPVRVTTDHRALQHWATEHVDTPSGPRGRRARWHETLSLFDLEVVYVPGVSNVIPDALSRWAYPATSSREDVSFHGSAGACEEVKKMVEEEKMLGRAVGVIRRKGVSDGMRKLSGDPLISTARNLPLSQPICEVGVSPAVCERPSDTLTGDILVATRSGKQCVADDSSCSKTTTSSGSAVALSPSLAADSPNAPDSSNESSGTPADLGAKGLNRWGRPHVDLGFRFKKPSGGVGTGGCPQGARSHRLVKRPKKVHVSAESLAEGSPKEHIDLGYRFAKRRPWYRPDVPAKRKFRRSGAAHRGGGSKARPPVKKQADVMNESWVMHYEACATFGEFWKLTQGVTDHWPVGYKVFCQKLFHCERLCVPQGLVKRVLTEHHINNAHVGVERLFKDAELRFEFPTGTQVRQVLQDIRDVCFVCQACRVPGWSMKKPISMTPVPARVFWSVSLDLFYMPTAVWEGQEFDAFLLCVDRLSGWMVARPTQRLGLTGAKAARLLLDGSWGELGVPAVITCDLGPQFVAQFWENMCARLGVRCAYAQAHRHQANGRAEVGGRILQDILRGLLQDHPINWVEALPWALRVHHDMVNPLTGLSPYQILTGRDRVLAGLPFQPIQHCWEAQQYFDRMAEVDDLVMKALTRVHEKVERRENQRRASLRPHEKDVYRAGDWVWVLKPKPVGGVKMESWWHGPYEVQARVSDAGYRLKEDHQKTFDVHADQLKICKWDPPGPLEQVLRYPPPSDVNVATLPVWFIIFFSVKGVWGPGQSTLIHPLKPIPGGGGMRTVSCNLLSIVHKKKTLYPPSM